MNREPRSPLRVCYFGTYRAEYERNRLMIDRMRMRGITVYECHSPLWKDMQDREQVAAGGWRNLSFAWRVFKSYLILIWKYLLGKRYDIMVVGYPGQPDMPLARLLTWVWRKPLVWDVFMSIYLIAGERNIAQRSPRTLKLIKSVESLAMKLNDRLIVDTSVYADWYQETYRVPASKISLLPTGADDRIFQPQPQPGEADHAFTCLYYGTYIPNHGVQYIIEAAHLLADHPDIHFKLAGDGPEHARMVELAGQYALKNITFIDWLAKDELVKEIGRSDLCLGTFGTTPQSLMTIHNKILECMAMGKPVLSGVSPALSLTFQDEQQLYLCPRESGAKLAEKILAIQEDPESAKRVAQNGHTFFKEYFSMDVLSERLADILIHVH